MEFSLPRTMAVLRNTPAAVRSLLNGLPEEWIHANEGPDTWSPFDIVGHYVECERTNFIPRLRTILENEAAEARFPPFDRFAQLKENPGKPLEELLTSFEQLRAENMRILDSFQLDETVLDRTGIHPEFGNVTARQLLSTWLVHDMAHLAQIARVLAKQYKENIGPWQAYIRLVQ